MTIKKISCFYVLISSLLITCSLVIVLWPNNKSIIISIIVSSLFALVGYVASIFFIAFIRLIPNFFENLGVLFLWVGIIGSVLMLIYYFIFLFGANIEISNSPQIMALPVMPHPSYFFLGSSLSFINKLNSYHEKRRKKNNEI